MAVSIAVIGKDNAPLYMWVSSGRDELNLQFLSHTALDIIQEKVSPATKTPSDSRELYLGLLYASEEYKIYGYMTNTKIKLVIITDASNTTLRDNEIRMMFRRLHNAYTAAVCNPFYSPGDPLVSRKFDTSIGALVSGN
ncbi:Trafficking protein particle complex subunit 2 [Trinorchestia longiramus]|nr:Trafficking protein particle complex subunit 2 [Trinorchestia longiramus]